ncbi:MAG: GntR family transcriptional regulator [Rhodospirillales bacterium]|jgi:DNA-binding GntR family transcriptional regulator|nr:GntR family transcriptional regulator [Rhodospirillales bacterium]
MERSRSSLNERVQCELERLILRGVLKPGEHIKEQSLADRLGVSRSPIREACRALERAGLVETIPHRGVFVRQVDLQDATDVFDIRAELAGIVAREAVHNVSPKQARVLADLIERMDEAAARQDADTYLDLNLEFHAALYRLADNRRVAVLDRALGNELLVYRRRGLASGGGLEVSNREHRQMLSLLVDGKVEALERLLKQHISGGKHRFLIAIGAEARGRAADVDGADSHHPTTRTAK